MVRVSIGQIESGTDVDANLARIAEAVMEGAAQGARLVLLPEYAMYDKPRVDETFAAVAQPIDGEFVASLSLLAREHGIYLVAGMVERSSDEGRPYNTLVAMSPDGAVVARYRKAHLFDVHGYQESTHIATPDVVDTAVFQVDDLRVGLMTCYDLRFPEISRVAVDAGAELLVVASAWVPGPAKVDQWLTLSAARAIENTAYVVAVNQAAPLSIGTSVAIDPRGRRLLTLPPESAIAVVDIDPATVRAARERDPVLRSRRFRIVPVDSPSAER